MPIWTNHDIYALLVSVADDIGQMKKQEVAILADLATLTRKINHMSDTQADIDAKADVLVADAAALSTAVANIQAEIAALKAANPAVDTTKLDAAVDALSPVVANVASIAPAP